GVPVLVLAWSLCTSMLPLVGRGTISNRRFFTASSSKCVRQLAGSPDQLICLEKADRGNREPEGFGCLQINDDLKLRTHLHRDLPRVRGFEDLNPQTRCLPTGGVVVGPVAGEATALHEEHALEHGRNRPLCRGLHDETGNV